MRIRHDSVVVFVNETRALAKISLGKLARAPARLSRCLRGAWRRPAGHFGRRALLENEYFQQKTIILTQKHPFSSKIRHENHFLDFEAEKVIFGSISTWKDALKMDSCPEDHRAVPQTQFY